MEGIQTLKGLWPWPWPSIPPYGISSCSSHRPLAIYRISFKLKKLFVDGRTGGRTFFPSILLGRLPKNKYTQSHGKGSYTKQPNTNQSCKTRYTGQVYTETKRLTVCQFNCQLLSAPTVLIAESSYGLTVSRTFINANAGMVLYCYCPQIL